MAHVSAILAREGAGLVVAVAHMREATGPGQIEGQCREQQQSMASENKAQVSGCRGSGPTLPLPGHVTLGELSNFFIL